MAAGELVHARATASGYRLLRAWIAGLWIWEVVRRPSHLLSELPAEIYDAPALLRVLPFVDAQWFLHPAVLYGIEVASVVGLVVFSIGRGGGVAGLAAAVLVTVQQGLARSFAYVHHVELAMLYALYVLVLFELHRTIFGAEAGRVAGGNRAPRTTRWSLPFVGVLAVVCLTYSLTGVHRATHGGPGLFLSDSLEYWVVDRSLVFGRGLGHHLAPDAGTRAALAVGFATVTGFEILAPFALVWRRFRRCFVAVIAAFHVVTYLVMGIAFWQNLLLLPLFFAPAGAPPVPRAWSGLRARGRRLVPALSDLRLGPMPRRGGPRR